jgi:NADPH:quinone reductase
MNAWLVERYGEPAEMLLAEVAAPRPAPGEVLIRNRACGVNFFDLLEIRGEYQAKRAFPFTVGAEVSGVVEGVGAGAGFRPGDKVLAVPLGGGYAEYSAAPASRVALIPGGMSFEQAAGFPIAWQTAWCGLADRGRLEAGACVLVHGGAGGVGTAAIHVARALGARVLATASTAGKRQFCKSQGAEAAFDSTTPDWVDAVHQATGGRGVDAVFDPVGGDLFDLSSKCIAPGGQLLTVGFASGRIPSIAANRLLLKNIAVTGVWWGRQADEDPAYFRRTHENLVRLLEQGMPLPPAAQTWPLAEAPAALRALAARKVQGKAILTLP